MRHPHLKAWICDSPLFPTKSFKRFCGAKNFLNFHALGPQEFLILDGAQDFTILTYSKTKLSYLPPHK